MYKKRYYNTLGVCVGGRIGVILGVGSCVCENKMLKILHYKIFLFDGQGPFRQAILYMDRFCKCNLCIIYVKSS